MMKRVGWVAALVVAGVAAIASAQIAQFPGQLFVWSTPNRKVTAEDTARIGKEVEAIQAFLGLGGANVLSTATIDTSLKLRTLVTDETGTGTLVFANTPTLRTPILFSYVLGTQPTAGDPNRITVITGVTAGSCTAAGASSTVCIDNGAAWVPVGGSGGTGTVTSVAAAVPAEFSVSGSPITAGGTLTIAKVNQAANVVFAGPTAGGSAQPGFRVLAAADIPSLDASKITAGTLATARGGLNFNSSGVAKGGVVSGTGAGTYGITVVGVNDKVLTADSTAAGGVAWKDPPTGAGDIATVGDCATGACFTSIAQALVFASPTGSTGAGSFRALAATDIPSLAASKLTSGTLATARGGVGADVSTIAKGGLVAGTGAGTFGLLGASTDGFVLTLDATQATGMKWGAAGSGTVTGTGTSSRVSYWSSTNGITSDGALTFDGSSDILSVDGSGGATGIVRTTRSGFGSPVQNELRSTAVMDSGPALILRNISAGSNTGNYLEARGDHSGANESILWSVDKGGLARSYTGGGLIAGQRDPYWWPSKKYGKGQRVITYPSNGMVYVATNVTEATSSTLAPLASTSNPKGWPRPFVRYTDYTAGERIVPVFQGSTASGNRRYRVTANCTTATAPNYGSCITADCQLTSGTCTLECDDGVCAGGANVGKSCSEADAVTDCPSSTCTECPANSARVSGVTDGGVTWDWASYDAFYPIVQAKLGREVDDYDQVAVRHGDNHPGCILCDRGWAGTGSISGPMSGYTRWQGPATFATYDMSVRASNPSIQISAPRRSPVAALMYLEPRNPGDSRHVDNPENAPRLTATSGGSPGLAAGCWWITYSWESDLTGRRTGQSPPARVFVDGTTNNAVVVELLAPYPTNVTRAVINRGMTLGACPTVPQTAGQILFFRTAIITSPTNSYTLDGDDLTEQEMAFDTNTTPYGLFTLNQPHSLTVWSPSASKAVGLETMVVPTVRNGHKYLLYGDTSGDTRMPVGATPGAVCTTGASEPSSWLDNIHAGGFVTDGTCVWKEAGDDLSMLVIRAPNDSAIPTLTWREPIGLAGFLNTRDRVIGGIQNNGDLFLNQVGILGHPALRLTGNTGNGGAIYFGSGGSAPDVTLSRSGGSTLALDGNFNVSGALIADGTFRAPSDGIDLFPRDARTCNGGDYYLYLDITSNTVRKCVDGVEKDVGARDVDVAFAALGTPANGTERWCTDCIFANPCAGSGPGAFAKRINSAWRCD
jgi:hypothetical protein